MKLAPFIWLFAVSLSSATAQRDDSAAVQLADERRIQATITNNPAGLREILSDDLLYANADGRVQTKTQLLDALSSNPLNYLSVEKGNVQFRSIAAGAGVLSGEARFVVEAKGQRATFALRFLSVWREESGQWRLVAYQSSPLSSATAASGK